MKRVGIGRALLTLLALTGPAAARTLEEILEDKQIITADEAKEVKAAKEKEQAAIDKAIASIPPLPEWLRMVTLFGDVRVRNETFFQEGTKDRMRQRFRLRFGAKVNPNDEMEFGFKLVSGTSNDLIANNQTFTDMFTYKGINIANAYIKLAPSHSIGLDRPWVTVMGGKFDQPFYVPPSPEMLNYDKDLTPEGFFETLKAVDEKDGILRTVSLNMGQFIFQENSTTGEAAIYGFQGLTTLAFDKLMFNLAPAVYHYVDPSSIAVARNSNSQLQITNCVELSDKEVICGKSVNPATAGPNKNGMTSPVVDPVTGEVITPAQPITITRFLSGFNVVDIPMDLLIPTGWPKWPVRLFGDYAINTDASSIAGDQAYEGGFTIGSSRDPCDIWFSYSYEHLETDAVVSAFTNSDTGPIGGTNVKGNTVQAGYVLTKNLSLLSTAYITKPVDDVPGLNKNTAVRWQVDVIGKF